MTDATKIDRGDLERLKDSDLEELGELVGAELRRRHLMEGERIHRRLEEFRFVMQRTTQSSDLANTADALLRSMEEIHDRAEALKFRYRVERDRLEGLVASLPEVP